MNIIKESLQYYNKLNWFTILFFNFNLSALFIPL